MAALLKRILFSLALLTAFGLIAGCDEMQKETGRMHDIDMVSAAEWKILMQRRVLFGHQSVGNNILSGVQSLAKQANVDLPVTKSRTLTANPGITHFSIGKNEDPHSKIADFSAVMTQGTGQTPDIALMKLCYIDFNNSTDGAKLAEAYSATLDNLSRQFPNVTMVAMTAPLTTLQGGPKAWVKELLGRTPDGYSENACRLQFNNVLRARYNKEGRLFDLARLEDEGAGSYRYQGQSIEVLNAQLSDDGGHLNDQGRQYVAAKFLKFLAALPLRQQE